MDLLRIFVLLLLISTTVCGQDEGIRDSPARINHAEVIHFDRDDFHADSQFWTACEDQTGILYFGNNDGVIVYDGEEWHKIFLPNHSSVRSLVTDNNGNVYAGGFNELGQIKRDSTGLYYYHSLMESLQLEDENFENLWQAHLVDGRMVFRSFEKLFVVANSNVTELPAANRFIRSYVVNGRFYVQDIGEGILWLNFADMSFHKVLSPEAFGREEIIGLYDPDENQEFLGITKSGDIFRFRPGGESTMNVTFLFTEKGNNQVISSLSSGGVIYAGTLSSGIIAFNPSGKIIYNDRNMQRLQDQAVHNLFLQQNGNLWALLNKGIDKINLTSPISVLFANASIYDVLFIRENIYLATNQGVFFSKVNDLDQGLQVQFAKIPGLEGQAWSLSKLNDELLIAHDKGLFALNNNQLNQIGTLPGIWKIIPVKDRPSFYLACSYYGLYVIHYNDKDDGWEVVNKIAGFDESTRDIVAGNEKNTYWVCHGYKGVFKIKVDESYSRITLLEQFTDKNGLPSPFNINCFRWNGQLVFTTNGGIFRYDEKSNTFKPHLKLNSILNPAMNTRMLLQNKNRTWFVLNNEAGYFNMNEKQPELHVEPFFRFKGTFNRSMELIHPLDSNRVLVGTNNGLYLVNFQQSTPDRSISTQITGIQYFDGATGHGLPIDSTGRKVIQLPHTTSLVTIHFAAPGLSFSDETLYSYQLSNVDNSWSPWQSPATKEYNHLPPGNYTFKVRSRGITGAVGSIAVFHFDILPIWYHTTSAYIGYALTGLMIFSLLLYWTSKKITSKNKSAWQEEQKARKLLELELKEVKLQSENERMEMEKELLKDDVISKSKELANYTMLLIKKREVISELREELRELRESLKGNLPKKRVRDLLHKLDRHMSNEDHLMVFETNFEKVHQDFFTSLRTLHPELSQRELQLCAFVKMNLANKEISPLLNISVRGVETARYRIRKKLDLEHEENLVEFLESLSPSPKENNVF